MADFIPVAPKKGETIRAGFLEKVRTVGNQNVLSVAAPLFIKSRNSENGTCIGIQLPQGDNSTGSFQTYTNGGGVFGVLGGNVVFQTLNFTGWINGLDPVAMSDGIKIWLQFDGGGLGNWSIHYGAVFPSDKINITLATISGTDVSFVNGWQGGNIVIPEAFQVNTARSGSSDPPIYNVTTEGAIQILTDAVPLNYRDSSIKYKAGGTGIAFWKDYASDEVDFEFYVLNEYADHETVCVAVVTAVDGSTPPCYTIVPMQYSLTKLLSPADCPSEPT